MSFAAHINIMGYQPSGSTTASTVWYGGSTSYVQLTSGTALEVVSASANDTAAGTGARTVRIEGVDSSYLPVAETVTMNGATPVALANTSMIGINKFYVLTAGSGLANAGNIDVRTVSGATVKSRIQVLAEAINYAQDFVYTVPANQYGLLKNIQVYARTNTGDIWAYLKLTNSSGISYVRAVGQHSLEVTGFNSGTISMDFGTGLFVPEKTLITLVSDVSAGTPVVSAIAELELYIK